MDATITVTVLCILLSITAIIGFIYGYRQNEKRIKNHNHE